MALQDLTPQLRTRLSRMERAVGWFVILATALLAFGFGYYVYKTAQRKGWFLKKITYQTCVSSGAGLKIGDPVKLMGFDVGEITAVIPNDPYAYYNITIQFRVKVDQYGYQGYIWSDSTVKVNAGDLLGNRFLEITKGAAGVPTILMTTNHEVAGVLRRDLLQQEQRQRLRDLKKREDDAARASGKSPRPEAERLAQVLRELNLEAGKPGSAYYTNDFRHNIYFLDPLESPAITERLDQLVRQAEAALPNILNLTNQISAVLSNSAALAANLNDVALNTRPAVSNLALLTARLNEPGALGDWLLPTNVNRNLDASMASLAEGLGRSLEDLAGITSNLHAQVEANTNLLSGLSRAIVDADDLVQGLKRHWLLRSAFKSERTNTAPVTPRQPVRSPRDAETR